MWQERCGRNKHLCVWKVAGWTLKTELSVINVPVRDQIWSLIWVSVSETFSLYVKEIIFQHIPHPYLSDSSHFDSFKWFCSNTSFKKKGISILVFFRSWQKRCQTEEEWRREWGNRHVRQISTVSASSLPPKALWQIDRQSKLWNGTDSRVINCWCNILRLHTVSIC